jgi:probable rRNA maturation factor
MREIGNIDINNKTRSGIDLSLVRRVVGDFLRYYGVGHKTLSIAFVGDKTMRRLNREYRGQDRATDILSFAGEDNDLGELIIDYAQIKRQAFKYSKSTKDELVFILVHGLLHLHGHEDESEQGRLLMEKLGIEFIEKHKI